MRCLTISVNTLLVVGPSKLVALKAAPAAPCSVPPETATQHFVTMSLPLDAEKFVL